MTRGLLDIRQMLICKSRRAIDDSVKMEMLTFLHRKSVGKIPSEAVPQRLHLTLLAEPCIPRPPMSRGTAVFGP